MTEGSAGRLIGELDRGRQRTLNSMRGNMTEDQAAKAEKKLNSKLSGNIVCISACYYAAKEVGMDSKDSELKGFPAADVKRALLYKLDEVKATLREDTSRIEEKSLVMNLVSQLLRQSV